MAAITSPIPVDANMFTRIQYFSSEPAYQWENGEPTDIQAKAEDGRPLYHVKVAVQYPGPYDRDVTELLDIRSVAESRGENPDKTCFGKPIKIDGLAVANQLRNTQSGGAFLQQRWTADSIGPVGAASSASAPKV